MTEITAEELPLDEWERMTDSGDLPCMIGKKLIQRVRELEDRNRNVSAENKRLRTRIRRIQGIVYGEEDND